MAGLDSDETKAHRFSTMTLAERDRVPFWKDLFGRTILHCDIDIDDESPFRADANFLTWPGLHALWSSETHMRYTRSAAQTSGGDDSLVILLRRTGISKLSQRSLELTAGPGEAIAFLGAEPAIAEVSDIDALNIAIPCSSIGHLVSDIADKTMKLVPANCEALRLLTGYADSLRDNTVLSSPELRQLAATHIQDLVAMILGATGDGAELAEKRGGRAARLKAIKAHILGNLTNPALTVRSAALAENVTPRYIHMLFEIEGVTFSEFVVAHRLDLAFRILKHRQSTKSISAIAYSLGFGDLSYFNRRFRSRFGLTPSDVRNEVCSD